MNRCIRLGATTILLFAYMVLDADQSWAQDYGTFVLYPQGSVRAMAMGGANASIVDDATSVVFNPAGAALSSWKLDFGGANNNVDNRELATSFPDTYGSYETQYDSPHSYLFYAAAARFGDWVFGAGYSNPFYNDYTYINPISGIAIERLEIGIKSFDAMVARRFGKSLAIGVAGHYETVRQAYRNSSIVPSVAVGGISEEASGHYFSAGVAWRSDRYGLGFAHVPERKIAIEKSGDDSLEAYNTVVYRDTIVPSKTTFGFFVRPVKSLMVSVDIDRYAMVSNAIYVSAVTTSYTYIKGESFQVIHGGLEFSALSTKMLELILRAGAYNEPTRFIGGQDRSHVTYGCETRVGPFVYSFAQDQAKGFNNSSHGVSLNLKGI